jgi:hypothetical protein
MKIQRHVLPFLGSEVNEWDHKKLLGTPHVPFHHQIRVQALLLNQSLLRNALAK